MEAKDWAGISGENPKLRDLENRNLEQDSSKEMKIRERKKLVHGGLEKEETC